MEKDFFEALQKKIAADWPEFPDQSLIMIANFGCGYFDFYGWRVVCYEASAAASAEAFRACITHDRPGILFHILQAQRLDLFQEDQDGLQLIFWGLSEALWRGHLTSADMVAAKMKAFRLHPEAERGPLEAGIGGFFDTWGPHPYWRDKEKEPAGFLWEEPGSFEKRLAEIMADVKAVKPRKKRKSPALPG